MSALDEAIDLYARLRDLPREQVEATLAEAVAHEAAQADLFVLPAAERNALQRTGTPVRPDGAHLAVAAAQGDLAHERMRARAVPVADAARRLGLTDSALRRVIGTTTGPGVELLGAKTGRGAWRVFAYQLPDSDGNGGQPATTVGRRAQRALPPGMHPVAVAAWWDAPNAGLYLDETEHTPRGWIAAGLDPDRVTEVALHEDAG